MAAGAKKLRESPDTLGIVCITKDCETTEIAPHAYYPPASETPAKTEAKPVEAKPQESASQPGKVITGVFDTPQENLITMEAYLASQRIH